MYFGRGKNKIQNVLNPLDIYKEYLLDHKESSVYYVSQTIFITISSEFNKKIKENLLKGKRFNLPFGLGYMEITKSKIKYYKTSNYSVDWKATLEAGKKIYYLNEHSDSYNYNISWEVPNNREVIKAYRFVGCRNFKRTLAKIIKNREQDYYEKI